MTDDVTEVEPDAVPEAVPDVPPTVVEHPKHESETGVGERLDRLEASLTDLASTVAELVKTDEPEHESHDDDDDNHEDESPVSKPWTHRGFGSH